MLKINLLPIRQLKKRAKAQNQILSALFALGCILVILGLIAFVQANTISASQKRIADLNKEKKKYSAIIAKIKKYQVNINELERRIKVINKLHKNSSLTVRILDEVTKRVDTSRVWLTNLNQQGGSLSLTGIALDNETVAQLMNSLKESRYINSVALGSSSLKKVSGKNLKAFSLSCSVGIPEEKKPEEKKKKQAAKVKKK